MVQGDPLDTVELLLLNLKSLQLRVLRQHTKKFSCAYTFGKIISLFKEVQCDNMPHMWGMLSQELGQIVTEKINKSAGSGK